MKLEKIKPGDALLPVKDPKEKFYQKVKIDILKDEKQKPEPKLAGFFDKVRLFFSEMFDGAKDVYATVKSGINAVSNLKTILIWGGVIAIIIILLKVLW